MKKLSISILLSLTFLSGCATFSAEPPTHLSDCHVADGMLLNAPNCISDHNKFVEEKRAKAERRQSAALDLRPHGHIRP